MTKTSVFEQEETEQKKELKPIKFERVVAGFEEEETTDKTYPPNNYNKIVLLEINYYKDLDLMWAYYDEPNKGVLYLGHWNDGVVE